MKRSEINEIIQYTMDKIESQLFPFPEFAYYGEEDWKNVGTDQLEIIENMLGWDITDFGTGDFSKTGLTIFVYRNGNFHQPEKYGKPYAEKLLYMRDGQEMPFHYHWYKIEDVINRGGGELEITFYNSTPEDFADVDGAVAGKEGQFADTMIEISRDGRVVTLPPGGKMILKPGESVTIKPGVYHSWKALEGKGDVILFEVSRMNDDNVDNRFKVVGGRFPEIEEDEEKKYFIFKDYDALDVGSVE